MHEMTLTEASVTGQRSERERRKERTERGYCHATKMSHNV